MGGNERRMPRRYGVGRDGHVGRTWGGKLPEESGLKEQLLFAADNDLALYGMLTVGALDAVREAGFRYEAGKLLSLEELAGQGVKNRGKYPEAYRLSLGEAKSREETGRFWDSDSLNSHCRLGMDSAISFHYKDGVLPRGCLSHILEEYGFDRVEWVLANTICQHGKSAKISEKNREWAAGFHVPRNDPIGGSTWLSCVMNSPVEAVEQAAVMVQREHAMQKQKSAGRRPSIREQLVENAFIARNSGMDKGVAEEALAARDTGMDKKAAKRDAR